MNIPMVNIDSPNEIKRHNYDEHRKREVRRSASGLLTQKEQIVLVVFESGTALSRNHIAEKLAQRFGYRNPPLQSVCARVSELMEVDDYLEILGTVCCPISGKTVHGLVCTDAGVVFADQAKHKLGQQQV